MAVHAALLAGREGLPGKGLYLAAVHDLSLSAGRLDQGPERLLVEARRLMAMREGLMYQVRIDAAAMTLLSARVTVMARPGGWT
jgi:predicted hotdog family 3-hydroxylacyl-ACP dehydratase